METTQVPVKQGRKRAQFGVEKKLAILQEWQQGVPIEELCRKYGFNAYLLHRWKQAMDRSLKDQGELIPKSQVTSLQKRIEELERALGRKTLELDVLKKACELKGVKLPEAM